MDEVIVVNSSLPRAALKRKQKHDLRSSGPIKKARPTQSGEAAHGLDPSAPIHVHEEDLQWKSVSRHNEAGLNDEEGMVMLEEVEGVDIEYEQAGEGKLVKFKLSDAAPRAPTSKAKIKNLVKPVIEADEAQDDDFDSSLLPQWADFQLHSGLLKSLYERSFVSPTPIQSGTLRHGLSGRDVIGVAETGSGKTLAYGLPVLQHILQRGSAGGLAALILAPTRELAIQVSDHLTKCAQSKTSSGGPRVSIGTIVGGMSAHKQRRIIDRGVDVLVATPGRLWDIIGEEDGLAQQIKKLRFLVLDEADRMIEAGHYAELENILRLTLRPGEDQLDQDFGDPEQQSETVDHKMQTFVFSATLSKDLQHNLKRRKTGASRKAQVASTLDDLLLRLDFRDPEPVVVDLSPQGSLVSTLQESMIECITSDKDLYLYYFLLRYPGRSLIFVSSIDGIRRLAPLLDLLQLKAWPLHSQLEQKQRLKNLDRFKSTPNSVLVATDVAARGLDVPAVDHVIHYQAPRSADLYVHRNGRTARAKQKGFGLLICGPDERKLVRGLMGKLGRSDSELPELPVDHDMLDKLKQRIQVARKIDLAHHRVRKENHERNWMKEAAEAMDIEIDEDLIPGGGDEPRSSGPTKAQLAKTAALKAELRQLLSQPLVARGISAKYITSGARSIADELVHGNSHGVMLGLSKAEAGEDVIRNSKTTKGKRLAKTSGDQGLETTA